MRAKQINTPRQSKANIPALQRELNVGIVTFEFLKKDGSRRRIIGTRCLSNIPLDRHPKNSLTKSGESRKQNDSILTVFDLQKNEWRSFSKSSITEIFC